MSDSKPTTAECVDLLRRTANSHDIKAKEHKNGDGWLYIKEAKTLRASIDQLLAAQEMAKAWVKLNKRMKDAGSLKRACAFVDHPITIKAIADWKAVGGQ